MKLTLAQDQPPGPSFRLRQRLTFASVLYTAVLFALFAGAAAARFRLPQAPLFDPDYGSYLRPALSLLTGHGFTHVHGRDSLYPAFISGLLELLGDFRAIAIVQHLLGLATGGLMLLAYRRGFLLLRHPRTGFHGISPFLGLLPAAAYLTAPTAIFFEQSIRPEAIFPMVAVLSIYLNLEFILHRWIAPAPAAAAWLGAGQIVVSVVAYKLKPSFGFALLFVNLPVLTSLLAGGVSLRSKSLMVGGSAAFCALFLFWPESTLARSDPNASIFLPTTLLTIHADQVRDQIAEDLKANRPSPFPRQTVQALLDRLDATLPLSRRPENRPYPSLGFNPDYLFHTNDVYQGVLGKDRDSLRERAQLGYYYYQRAFIGHPRRMLDKIWRQLRLFYHFGTADHAPLSGQGFHLRADRLELAGEYQQNVDLYSAPVARQNFDGYPPTRRFIEASRQLSRSSRAIEQGPILTLVRRALELMYLPGLLGTLFITGWAAGTGRLRAGWLLPIAVTWLILSYNLGNNLTVAVVHSLDVGRYISNQLAYTLLASTFSILLIGETARRLTAGLTASSGAVGGSEAGLAAAAPAPAWRGLDSKSAPPSLGVLILSPREDTDIPGLVTAYRTVFPSARLLVVNQGHASDTAGPAASAEVLCVPGAGRTQAVIAALTSTASDVVILVEGSGRCPAEGALRLFESYCACPADLIAGVRPGDGQRRDPLSRVIALVCGRQVADSSGGLRLCSRRFYENVPILARGFGWELELTLQAIDKGFELREVAVPRLPSAPGTPPAHWAVSTIGRALRLFLVLCHDFRPLLSCSILAAVIFLLSGWAGFASMQNYAARRARNGPLEGFLAASLLILSGVLLQTGVLLAAGLRRRREEAQLRIRDWMRRNMG